MAEYALPDDFIDLMMNMSDERGVPKDDSIIDKNILRQNDPILSKNKVNPILSSSERKRYISIFTLFSQVFLNYKKKEMMENQKSATGSALKTVSPPPLKDEKKKSSWCSFLGLLVGGVLLVAAAIPTLIAAMFAKLGPVADTLKILGKAGLMGGLKLMKAALMGAFKGGWKALKFLPIIGSIVNFWLAYEHFKSGKNGIIPGVIELVSGFANFIPGVGGFISIGIDILKAYLDYKGVFDEGGILSADNAWGTIKGWAKSIGNKIWENALWLPILGGIKRFGMAKDHFSSGNYGEGLKEVLKGILSFTGAAGLVRGYEVLAGFLSGKLSEAPKELNEDSSWTDRMVEWIREKLNVLPWWIKKPLSWFGLIPDEMAHGAKETISVNGDKKTFYERAKEWITERFSRIPLPMRTALKLLGLNFDKTSGEDASLDFLGNSHDGLMEKTKGFVGKVWDSAISNTEKTWNNIRENAPKVWDRVKEISLTVWDENRNMGAAFRDGITNMAKKTKNALDSWVPGVIESISGIADSAKELLKSIGRKIGKWIVGLFRDDEKESVEGGSAGSSGSNKLYNHVASLAGLSESIFNESANQVMQAKTLVLISRKHTELLTKLVEIETMALQQLKRLGGKSGASSPNVNLTVPIPRETGQLVPIGDNRAGYMNSPYALA